MLRVQGEGLSVWVLEFRIPRFGAQGVEFGIFTKFSNRRVCNTERQVVIKRLTVTETSTKLLLNRGSELYKPESTQKKQ